MKPDSKTDSTFLNSSSIHIKFTINFCFVWNEVQSSLPTETAPAVTMMMARLHTRQSRLKPGLLPTAVNSFAKINGFQTSLTSVLWTTM